MSVDLKNIVTKSDLQTLHEMQNDELADFNDIYASMLKTWQSKLDQKISKQQAEAGRAYREFWDRTALFSKWFVGVVTSVIFVIWIVFSVNGCFRNEALAQANAGFIEFKSRIADAPIKGAPQGVTLTSLGLFHHDRDKSGFDATLTYTLNLPRLPSNQVYAITHEILSYTEVVVGNGLFYTKPGENGIVSFSKEYNITSIPDWTLPSITLFRVSVKIMDVDSVPKDVK